MSDWTALRMAWQACFEEAWTAYTNGSFPIGAAILDDAGNIVARGRNSVYDVQGTSPVQEHPLAHAELNALLAWSAQGTPPATFALYTTTEPCPLCMGALYMSGIRKLHFAAREPFAGSVNLIGTTPYLSRKNMVVCPPDIPGLERIFIATHTEFVLRRTGDSQSTFMDVLRAAHPGEVALGEAWHDSGLVRELFAANVDAETAFNRLRKAA